MATKKDLARSVKATAEGFGLELSLKNAELLFEAVLDTIKSAVKTDGAISVKGFGTLKTKTRAARDVTVSFLKDGSGPKKIHVEESTTVGFKPASTW